MHCCRGSGQGRRPVHYIVCDVRVRFGVSASMWENWRHFVDISKYLFMVGKIPCKLHFAQHQWSSHLAMWPQKYTVIPAFMVTKGTYVGGMERLATQTAIKEKLASKRIPFLKPGWNVMNNRTRRSISNRRVKCSVSIRVV